MIKGITIKLEVKTESGTDAFNRPSYTTEMIEVANVLVGQPTEDEVTDTLNLTGRKCIYTLAIPKSDTHDWVNKKVEFFGESFKTIGKPIEGIEDMIPLMWNKKVRCELIE